jgi:hypothetical protein
MSYVPHAGRGGEAAGLVEVEEARRALQVVIAPGALEVAR